MGGERRGEAHLLRSMVLASGYRARVVEALRSGPQTPSAIADTTGLHRPHVTRALRELEARQALRFLTPTRRKGRLYALEAQAAVALALTAEGEGLPRRRPSRILRNAFLPKCRGEALLAGVAAAAEVVGPESLRRLSQALGADLLGLEAEAWYPIGFHHDLLSILRRLPGGQGLETCREVGRRSIAYLPHLHGFLTRGLGLAALAERIPLVHGHYSNFGRFDVAVEGNFVEVRQSDMLPTRAFCAARRGNYEGVFRVMGYQPQVIETTCGTKGHGDCTFRIEVRLPPNASWSA